MVSLPYTFKSGLTINEHHQIDVFFVVVQWKHTCFLSGLSCVVDSQQEKSMILPITKCSVHLLTIQSDSGVVQKRLHQNNNKKVI